MPYVRIDYRVTQPGDVNAATGVDVDVRTRFDGRWSTGFELVEIVCTRTGFRYRVRARGGEVLPALFRSEEVRASTLAAAMALDLVPVAFEE